MSFVAFVPEEYDDADIEHDVKGDVEGEEELFTVDSEEQDQGHQC